MKTDAHVIYRAQPIGSMPRPRHLKQAREDAAAGRLSPVELKRVEEGAVDDAIAAQEQAGLDVVTDGEARRGHFPGSLSEAVTGLRTSRLLCTPGTALTSCGTATRRRSRASSGAAARWRRRSSCMRAPGGPAREADPAEFADDAGALVP